MFLFRRIAGCPPGPLQLPTRGGLYAWEFEQTGRALSVRVDGLVSVNEISLARQAARNGLGIAHPPEDILQREFAAGTLVRVLADWCPYFLGYHLYYPSRCLVSPALSVLVGALCHRALPGS